MSVRPQDLAAARRLALSLLDGPTPDTWVAAALADLDTLLLDHAECEKKAAASAMSLLYRYGTDVAFADAASRFAREELRHFEMVNAFMRGRGVAPRVVPASRYAGGLLAQVRRHEPARLLDMLLVAALIEARSLERFVLIVERTDDDALARFYGKLLASEARHARTYLALAARRPNASEIEARLAALRVHENALVQAEDDVLRFHSGRPAWLAGHTAAQA
jgi:tRNA-(ms[2]io[6]A)-hydroxylase